MTNWEWLVLNFKRGWYLWLDLCRNVWCNGCQMSWPGIPHTCSGKHLYPIHQTGNQVTEFGITYYRRTEP